MGDVVKAVFKPVGALLGIKQPKLPDTDEAKRRAEELGVPSEEDLQSQQIDEETRRRLQEQGRRRALSRRNDRALGGTGSESGGLISGTTGNSNSGNRLIGM